MLKDLYQFTVDFEKEVEESSTETRTNAEGAEEKIEIKKKVKKALPVEILIKKPSRRQIEDADTEFSICMSDCVKKGILTKAMLAKKYADTGGALAEDEAQNLLNLYKEAADIEREISRLSIKGLDKNDKNLTAKMQKYDSRIAEIKRHILETESDYRVLFDCTADVKAQNRVMMWYVMNLTYYKSLGLNVPEFVQYFNGETFKEKMEDYYQKDENDDELFLKIIGKVSAVISYWYFSGSEFSKEDVDEFLQENDEITDEIIEDGESTEESAKSETTTD